MHNDQDNIYDPELYGKTHFAVAAFCCFVAFLAAWSAPHPLMLTVTALIPVLAGVCLRKPFFICLTFIAFSQFRLHEAFPFLVHFHLPSLMAVLTLGCLVVMVTFKRATIAWCFELKLFSIFFVIVTIGIVFSTGRELAFDYWLSTFSKIALMVFAIASLARTPADFGLAMRTFVTCGILVALVALDNQLRGIGLVEGSRVTIGRDIHSVLGDPNDLALVLLFPMSFALALAATPGLGRHTRIFGVVGAVLIIAAILATQSRGGMLGLLAVGAVFVMRAHKSHSRWVLTGSAGTAVIVVLVALSNRVSSARAGDAIALGEDEASTSRLNLWWVALKMAADHPLTGVGLNNFRANNFFYNTAWDGLARAVHSTWLGVLSEGGILAFGVFVVLVASIARLASKSARTLSPEVAGAAHIPVSWAMARALLGGMAGFVVSGTFLTEGFTWPIYILLALTVAIGRYATTTPHTHLVDAIVTTAAPVTELAISSEANLAWAFRLPEQFAPTPRQA